VVEVKTSRRETQSCHRLEPEAGLGQDLRGRHPKPHQQGQDSGFPRAPGSSQLESAEDRKCEDVVRRRSRALRRTTWTRRREGRRRLRAVESSTVWLELGVEGLPRLLHLSVEVVELLGEGSVHHHHRHHQQDRRARRAQLPPKAQQSG